MPQQLSEIKLQLVPDDAAQERLVHSWKNLLGELKTVNEHIREKKQDIIPQVSCAEFVAAPDGSQLLEEIKKRGAVVIHDVIPSHEAAQWLVDLKAYVKSNPSVVGYPAHDPQVLELYWTPSQLAARSHPSLLAASTRLNTLFHAPPDAEVALKTPLTYADRLRIRHPGNGTFINLGPHVDSGGAERWQDWEYSRVYKAILDGRWSEHNAYDLTHRLNANANLDDTPGGCTLLRTFQGWLSLSNSGPNEGTLGVYPSLVHSTAYNILRPFFRPITPLADPASEETQAAYLHPDNWELDLTPTPIPGTELGSSQALSTTTHPHLDLDHTMISVPKVAPGDAVFWTCDTIHLVEKNHNGTDDSSVLYIPAVPLTQPNVSYLARQRNAFLAGTPGPDFPRGPGESGHPNRGRPENIAGAAGRRAMGLEALETRDEMSESESRLLRTANEILSFGKV